MQALGILVAWLNGSLWQVAYKYLSLQTTGGFTAAGGDATRQWSVVIPLGFCSGWTLSIEQL